MTDAVVFILLALSVYRALRLVQSDTLLARPRHAFYNRFPNDATRASMLYRWEPSLREMVGSARPVKVPRPKVARMGQWLACPWCCGAWVSALGVWALTAFVSVPLPLLWWGACSTVVGLLAGWER